MKKPELVEVSQEQINELLALTKGTLPQEKYQLLEAVLGTFVYLMHALQSAKTSLKRLQRMLFGASTESKGNVLKQISGTADGQSPQQPPAGSPAPGEREGAPGAAALEADSISTRKGHGRNGAQAYAGATVITVEHPTLKPGAQCPECGTGKVYTYESRRLIRWIGQAPLAATVYHLERLRCRLCDSVFSAPLPAGVDDRLYDESSAAMLALLRYGSGMPFYRLQGLQANLQLPLPDATQWEIVERAAPAPRRVFEELIRQAAQAPLLHNDDTPAKILELMGKSAKNVSGQEGEPAQARAVNTSGIVALLDTHKVVLYFTGPKHAGENLARVLAHRAQELAAPIQMCDALSRNYPKDFETTIANCLVHARRNFVDIVEQFPEPCRSVIEQLAEVYRNDAHCTEHHFTPAQRLAYHQEHSGPRMQELKTWMDTQIEQRLVEQNSGLGKAIKYMRKRWNRFTLFLRQAGAPLDNNICERGLKKAILHRKGSLYYRTVRGAEVGDIYMSLIATCEHCGVNPFEYLKALQRHAERVREHPQQWLPWNYHTQFADTS